MKKSFVFVAIAIALVATSCGTAKKAAPTTIVSQSGIPTPSITGPSTVYAGEMDFGFGKSFNKGQAYTNALRNAQENIATRLYRGISAVDEAFARDTQNAAQLNTVSNRTSKIVGIIDNKVVSVTLMKDPTYTKDEQGAWDCEVQVFLDAKVVKETAKAIYNTLSDDDVLRVKFEEQQFQEEYEKQLKEYRATHK